MASILASLTPESTRWLLVAASPREAAAVASGVSAGALCEIDYWRPVPVGARFEVLLTGVGKSNAAGAVARSLDPVRHAGVINLGIAGVLPGDQRLELGAAVIGSPSLFADEGLEAPDGFRDLASMGFAATSGIPNTDPRAFHPDEPILRAMRDAGATAAPIATVSTCSGTDALARAIAARTHAAAEAMEGAAVALAACRVGGPRLPFAEVRVISNTTGDRARQRWDLDGALSRLGEIAALL